MKGPIMAVVVVSALLAGCARIESFEPTTLDELPPRPGLFSGKDGAFYIAGGGAKAAGIETTRSAPSDPPGPVSPMSIDTPPLLGEAGSGL